ncbi:MAG TPA: hypothetical protein VGM39_16225 [Kofleriaceae bacterium]
MRALCLVTVALLAGCYVPTHRSLAMERDKVFTTPGSTQMFSSTARMEHRKGKGWALDSGKSDDPLKSEDADSDTTSRSVFYFLDPVTRAEQRFGELRGEGTPVYYDATHQVLWLRDNDRELHGIGKGPIVGPDKQTQLDITTLEPPFVLTAPDTATRALYDLSSGAVITLPPQVDNARALVEGKVVHFTVIREQGDVVAVGQIGIDFSSGTPQHLPDIEWSTPPLPANVGERLALTVIGQRYAEVVRDQTQTRLLVYPLVAGSQPLAIPLPPADKIGKIATIGTDTLVFGIEDYDSKCWRGETIRLSSSTVTPLTDSPCVRGTAISRGSFVLETDRGIAATVNAAGNVVLLDDIPTRTLHDSLATSPTKRTLPIVDAAQHVFLTEVDLETGEQHRTPMKDIKPTDVFLDVKDGVARFMRDGATIVNVALAAQTTTVVKLDPPEMTHADRMPNSRNELWASFGGGGTTRSTGVGGLQIAFAHWLDDRWVGVGSFRAGFEAAPKDKEAWREYGGSFGFTWHRLPQMWSFNWGADIGANYAAAYVDKTRVDRAFAPSFELHAGWSGSIVGIDVTAIVPSLADLDRGVQFWASAKFGLTGSEYLH